MMSMGLSVPELLVSLDEIDRSSHRSWRGTLTGRKAEELEFHDRHRTPDETGDITAARRANEKYYVTTARSQDYATGWIREHAPGKVFLDYACGHGDHTIMAAKSGAELAVGIDISGVSIENAKRRAAEAGVSENTRFVQADCENTGLPDGCVDAIVCGGVLHHLDLSHAFPEMRRIMRPGGVSLGFEALNYNPFIKLYRRCTPSLRTEWERQHILSWKELRFARWFFDVRNVRYWHLLSVLATPLRNTRLFRPALAVGNACDAFLLRIFPLSLMAWMFSFELHRRQEE
jgi:SAM-dependent methyltransferase